MRATLGVLLVALAGLFADAAEAPAVAGTVGPGDGVTPPAMPALRLAQLAALDTTLAITLPQPAQQQRLSPSEDQPPGPLRIGFHRDLPAEYQGDLTDRLQWVTDPEDGSVTAAVTVMSPTALGMRMAIRAHLPPGGTIRFFRAEEVVGTFEDGRAAVPSDPEDQPLWWSPSVDGDTIGLEITLPSREALAESALELDRIAHRFRDMRPTRMNPQALRQSDHLECSHVEIACRDVGPIANAVARIVFETTAGSFVCSGTLMNATDQARTPYFMTAHHCVSAQRVASTLEALWFYQYTTCSGSTLDDRFSRTVGGADLLATSEAQDSTLLRLRRRPPAGASLAGWNSRVVGQGERVYGVHHPGGAEKKYVAGITEQGAHYEICGEDDECIFVSDAIPTDTEDGATEGGSSGSGLFVGEQLLGVLSGGDGCFDAAYGRFSDFFPKVERWLNPGPARVGRITVQPTTLEIPEGGTRSYDLRLSIAPRERVTVSISRTGDPDLTPQPTSVHFTPEDWRPWRIDVSAREDADAVDGSATIRHEVRTDDTAYQGIRVASVAVYERDNDHPPAQVTGVSATPTEEPGELRITWDDVPGADAYIVEWRQRSQGFAAQRRRVVRGATHTVLSDLDGAYFVRVTATRDGLHGKPSKPVSFVAEGQLRRFLHGWRLEWLLDVHSAQGS